MNSSTKKKAGTSVLSLQYFMSPMSNHHFLPTISATALGLLLAVATLANVYPDTFGGVFNGFLYNRESGVYADCSRQENRHNPYCVKRNAESKRNAAWSSMKRGGRNIEPFSLNGN